jgi:hypothetical protein
MTQTQTIQTITVIGEHGQHWEVPAKVDTTPGTFVGPAAPVYPAKPIEEQIRSTAACLNLFERQLCRFAATNNPRYLQAAESIRRFRKIYDELVWNATFDEVDWA